MDEMKKKAKMKVVGDLRNMAMDMMGSDLGKHMEGAKKVTVASKDTEGLKAGLEKAEDLVEGMPEEGGEETPSEEMSDLEEMDLSAEEIEEMMRILQEKKDKLEGENNPEPSGY